MKFYDLSKGYVYGEADDHIFDYYSSTLHPPSSAKQYFVEELLPSTEENFEEREGDLVQVCLANVVEAETVKAKEESKAKSTKRGRMSKFEILREKLMKRMREREM